MPIDGYFDTIFAVDGDLTPIPDPTQGSGTVSYQQGFPVGYSTPVGSGGFNFPRYQFNQLMNDITTAIQNWQKNTIAPFITSTMNGGSPYSYSMYNMVLYGGVGYISNTNGNTDTPPSSKWNTIPTSVINNYFTGGTTTGSANAQALATVSPAQTAFNTSGMTISCVAGFTNTGNMTFAGGSESGLTVMKTSTSGLVDLTGGEVVAGNFITLTKDFSGSAWILNVGTPQNLSLQAANNLSDVANSTTARTNISAAKSGANTDITSLQGEALIVTPLGVGSYITAIHSSGTTTAGTSYSASSLTPVSMGLNGGSSGVQASGDTITGTWVAQVSQVYSVYSEAVVMYQRIA